MLSSITMRILFLEHYPSEAPEYPGPFNVKETGYDRSGNTIRERVHQDGHT